jgi:hypothetical protein
VNTYNTITCQDCGRAYATKRHNTKFCKVCRLIRNMKFIGAKTKKCWECDTSFAPIERSDVMCGKCAVPSTLTGDCAVCQAHAVPMLTKEVKVCMRCAYDPEQRPAIFKGLLKRQKSKDADLGDGGDA